MPVDVTGVPSMYVFVDIGIDVAHLADSVRLNFELGARLALAGTIQFAGSIQARHSHKCRPFRGEGQLLGAPILSWDGKTGPNDPRGHRLRCLFLALPGLILLQLAVA